MNYWKVYVIEEFDNFFEIQISISLEHSLGMVSSFPFDADDDAPGKNRIQVR